MFETDLNGQPVEVDNLDADWLLAFAEDTDTKERQAARAKLRLAARWCVLNPATADRGTATWADSGLPEALECDESIGGDGTPDVAAFTAEPFAASMKISTYAGLQLMADALNLQHRLPRIWAKVESLEVVAWRARKVAQATSSLTKQAAAYVDQHLVDRISSCGGITIDRIIAEAVALFDPEAQAEREAKAKRNWGVRISHGNPDGFDGTSWIDAAGDTLDLTRFHDYVCRVAEQLRLDGDTDDLDIRKAKALGVIADQADGGVSARSRTAKTKLYFHLTLADLVSTSSTNEGGAGVGTVEQLGPATTTKIRDWANNSRMTIQPVLDMGRGDSVDRHDPPAWLRELVILRDNHCVFPWCTRDARACDLDHIEPYLDPADGGPPDQTSPANLAPLCRRHHRCKTVGRWEYQRLPDGNYEWRSPHARTYLVTKLETRDL